MKEKKHNQQQQQQSQQRKQSQLKKAEFSPARLLIIGKVGRPHGVRGAFFIPPRDEVLSYKNVWLEWSDEGVQHRENFPVLESKVSGGISVLRLPFPDSPEAVKKIRGASIYVPKSSLTVDREKEFLPSEYIGLSVLLEDGEEFATVVDIVESKAHLIFILQHPDKGEILLPVSYFEIASESSIKLAVTPDIVDELWQKKKK